MLISAKDIIVKSIDLYKKHMSIYLKYAALIAIPVMLLGFLSSYMRANASLMNFGFFTTFVVLAMIVSVFSLWVSVAFVRTIRDTYNETGTKSPMVEMKAAVQMIWPVILVSILTTLVVLGGIVLFIIPGIIFAIWYMSAYYEVALGGERGWKAMKVSRELVRGRWGATLWRLIAPAIVFAFISIIPQSLVRLLGTSGIEGFLPIIGYVGVLLSTIVSFLLTPLQTAAPTILFLELQKTKKTAK